MAELTCYLVYALKVRRRKVPVAVNVGSPMTEPAGTWSPELVSSTLCVFQTLHNKKFIKKGHS